MRTAGADDLSGGWAKRCAMQPPETAACGWRAELALRFARHGERTVLAARHHRGPLVVQRPFYPEADGVCHVYLLHPPAGIVGGDDLEMSFALDPGAHGLVTTPAATRWYFSRGVEARVCQRATLAAGATFEWLPQETLLFDGAHARLTTRIELEGGARFCGWEILALGRPACDETFHNGSVDFRFELWRDGRPLLLERLRGGAGGVAGMRQHAACATLLAAPAGETALEAARNVLRAAPDTLCAVTRMGDVVVARGLASRCEPLKAVFTGLWSALRPLVLGRNPVVPRIWGT